MNSKPREGLVIPHITGHIPAYPSEHLKGKSDAVVAYTSSVLGFVPLAATAVYSSTKAAVHSYVLSQRFMLRDTTVRVLEIAPPWVRTELMNSQEAEQAMPLEQFIEETIAVLRTDADEILVDAAKPLRANAGPNEHGLVNGFNAQMTAIFAGIVEPPLFTKDKGNAARFRRRSQTRDPDL